MWYVCDVMYAVLYIGVYCFVVRGCAVSRRYINVCNSNVFGDGNMYLDHLKFCVVCINGMSVLLNVKLSRMSVMSTALWLQTPQPPSGGAVTADTNCCANCVENPRPQQWRPDLHRFWASRSCGLTGWLALLLMKADDVEPYPDPTTSHKRVWICDICYKQIHVRKKIYIRCNRIEHWVHLKCAGISQAQYTDICTCHLHI